MKIKLLTSVLIIALGMMSGLSCHRNSTTLENNSTVFPRESSLEEASEVLGVDIPSPSYLPEGYEITQVILEDEIRVSLIITNKGGGKMELKLLWEELGIIPAKIPPNAPYVEINGVKGHLVAGDEENIIKWNWQPSLDNGLFVLTLLDDKTIPIRELLLIAESVGW